MNPQPITLEDSYVRLEPLSDAHFAPLCEVAFDPELWRWTHAFLATPDDLRRYLDAALAERDAGKSLPFATVHRESGRVVGCTRFGAIEPAHRKLEIGWTWIARPWQRTAVNTAAKRLMLTHAFETLGCQRVELKTNALNATSRAAIARLGATEEGTLRKHMINDRGVTRDTVYFSITDDEWPSVKSRLSARLG